MTLQSEVGVGSTFGFTVPLGNPAASTGPISDYGDPVVVVSTTTVHRST